MPPDGRHVVTDAPSAPDLKGGFDVNLDFPLREPYWASFFAGRWDISRTSDLDALTDMLLKQRLDVSYLPSANCFFLHGEKAYRGLASALSSRTRVPAQSSVLVVRGSSPVGSWHELRGAREDDPDGELEPELRRGGPLRLLRRPPLLSP
jgi:hypothetical protein